MILDGVSLYNLGYTRSEVCQLIKEKYGPEIKPSTLTNWIRELAPLCRYTRLRDKATKLYSPHQVIKSLTLNHQQVYYYRYHQAKLDLLLNQKEFSHQRFNDLAAYLTLIEKYCPHDYFQTGSRSSQTLAKFDLHKVAITRKLNHATRLAKLVIQAVGHNRLRHEALQQFMLANDSVTVAIEVPIFLSPEDLKHLTQKLRFQIPFNPTEMLTAHIDILQVRNGLIHILDYKPNAKSEKPYTQLTSYALALSRLTGLNLMDFKCA